jgi:hypothetical protein
VPPLAPGSVTSSVMAIVPFLRSMRNNSVEAAPELIFTIIENARSFFVPGTAVNLIGFDLL